MMRVSQRSSLLRVRAVAAIYGHAQLGFTMRASVFALAFVACASRPAQAAMTQLTSHEGNCSVTAPATNATASLVAFSSTCDWTGGNSDGNREIFQVDAQGTVLQLTDTVSCTSSNPAVNAIADVIAFDSDCDFGGNVDRNVEIFVATLGDVFQITDSTGCMNLGPAVNAAGDRVAFDSDCDLTGGNADASVEIFRAALFGAITQLTSDVSASGCLSTNASSDASGTRVAFESDCDLTGSNPDQVNEIFTHAGAGVAQITSSGDDPCINSAPGISEDGAAVAFESDCDLVGTNADNSTEIFVANGGTIVQVSDDPGATACESLAPAVSGEANVVVFAGYCDLLNRNPFGSLSVFRDSDGALVQLTGPQQCQSYSPAIAPDAGAVVFVSTCDPTGLNEDLGPELFRQDLCACGAPLSRNQPSAGEALIMLRAAVEASRCALCDCDVSGDGRIAASDALLTLRKAVGQDVTLACPGP